MDVIYLTIYFMVIFTCGLVWQYYLDNRCYTPKTKNKIKNRFRKKERDNMEKKKDIEVVKAYKQGYSDGYNDRIKHEKKDDNKENK